MILLGFVICLFSLGLFTTSLTNPYHEPDTEWFCIFLFIFGMVCVVIGIGTEIGFWDIKLNDIITIIK